MTSAPEDGDSVFLRNFGIDLQIHTAPKPKTFTINVVKTDVNWLFGFKNSDTRSV
jgi:hypothetical protein